MIVVVLATGLALVIALCVAIGIAVHRVSNRLGTSGGSAVATDESLSGMRTLYSEKFGLAGRPDQLMRVGAVLVPVEHKPRAHVVRESHVMQVAAECALVEAAYGKRPPYGVLVLAGGKRYEIHYTPALEHRLVQTMSTMRQYLRARVEPGPRWVAHKCLACGYHAHCWSELDS